MANFTTLPDAAVLIRGNQAKTTSLNVAEYFGKQHKDVIRKIECLDCSPAFTSAHFYAYVQNQEVGTSRRDLKHYEMTKDGFMFLVMGFTGAKAASIKEAFINAFNAMEARLLGNPTPRKTLPATYPRTAKDLPFVQPATPQEHAQFGHNINWWQFDREPDEQYTEANIARGHQFFLQLMRLASVNVSEAQKAARHAIMHLGSGLGGNVGLYAEETLFASYLGDAAVNWMIQDQKVSGAIRLPMSAERTIEDLPGTN
ncbi:MAG: Rha family transcriptional regulator [Plesiomonas sp.]